MPSVVIPLYTMVSFSRIRYSEALARFNRQTSWFEGFMTFSKIAFVSAFAGMYIVKRQAIFQFAKGLIK